MNNGSRYPYIKALFNGVVTVIETVLLIGLAYLVVKILVAVWRFFVPDITIIGLIIMIPLSIFVLIFGFGIITDIVRFIKDRINNNKYY